jgi:hypothetical protein
MRLSHVRHASCASLICLIRVRGQAALAGGRTVEATLDGQRRGALDATPRAAIHDLGGTANRITRPDPSRLRSGHESEDFAFECDEEVLNDGTLEDLYRAVWGIIDL